MFFWRLHICWEVMKMYPSRGLNACCYLINVLELLLGILTSIYLKKVYPPSLLLNNRLLNLCKYTSCFPSGLNQWPEVNSFFFLFFPMLNEKIKVFGSLINVCKINHWVIQILPHQINSLALWQSFQHSNNDGGIKNEMKIWHL